MDELNLYGLKNQLTTLMTSGKKITIVFQCGNDEAHIMPYIDGVIAEYDDMYRNLEGLIFHDLNLPSDGHYMVEGKGQLTLEDNNIYLSYNLEGFEYDYEVDENNPSKDIKEKHNDKYLLLSNEYDDPDKFEEYLSLMKNENINESAQSNFSKTDKELWDSLGNERTKPWWKFW